MTQFSFFPALSLRLTFKACAVACLIFGSFVIAPAQTAAPSAAGKQHAASLPRSIAARSANPGRYDPVADPKAVVRIGSVRFTVLTPQLIRMEWTADGKFEDHASFVFLNRHLPAPKFTVSSADGGNRHIIKTDALSLSYTVAQDSSGKFSADNLRVDFMLNGKQMSWRPGMEDKGNLMGTTRTLDGALGGKTREPIDPGLISRDGWVLVDDSSRPLFDSADFSFTQGEHSPWPWVMQRPAGDRQDWYFFGYGHDYKQALSDFTKVAGQIPLPPRFAFGTWWSRYWAYSDQEFEDLVRGFHDNDVPLDVLVIDMDWHLTFHQNWFSSENDQSRHRVLVARSAAGGEHENGGRESDVVAELRSLQRSGARGQASTAIPPLGRAWQSPLSDWILGRHDLSLGLSRLSAVVHRHGSERRLCVLESRHWRPYAGRGRSGAVHTLDPIRHLQSYPAHAHNQESRFGTTYLGLSRTLRGHHA